MMKFKSIVLIFVAFVFGVLFVVYSTGAQKSKANDETKNENQSQENLIAELRKNEVCTVLSENIMAKEAENLTMKRAKCEDSSPYVYLVRQKGEKELTISVIDLKTPEDAKVALRTTFGQEGFRPYNEFGE